jgi:hypothetical protein
MAALPAILRLITAAVPEVLTRTHHTEAASQVVRSHTTLLPQLLGRVRAPRPTKSSRSLRPRLRPTTRKSFTTILLNPANQASTSTVYFFGNVSSSVYTTSYITLAPAEPTEEPLYQDAGEETESYEDGDSSGWSAKFLHRRAEWCGDKPCRLVQYSDAVIAEACKQYGAAGGYPVGDVTTVTEYGPATETVTPTTCDATEYSGSTSKPTGGYGGHEEGSHESGGFEWPSKSTAGGEPSYGGHGGHGKPTGYGSGEYGSESTSTEEAWGSKPTGYGHDEPSFSEEAWGSKPTGYGGEHGHGKPSGAWGHDEPTSSEEAWGAESTPSGYPTGYGGEHGKPSGSWGHDEPTSTEAAWGADSKPTGYGGEHGHGKPSGGWGHDEPTSSGEAWGAESTPAGYPTGYGGEHGKPSGSWGHDEPTSTEAAWGADSTPTGYGGGEHGHGKPSGEWGAKPSAYGEHGGKGYVESYSGEMDDANRGNSGKPKMCKVKHPKKAKA